VHLACQLTLGGSPERNGLGAALGQIEVCALPVLGALDQSGVGAQSAKPRPAWPETGHLSPLWRRLAVDDSPERNWARFVLPAAWPS
jgi:hypothetical protein